MQLLRRRLAEKLNKILNLIDTDKDCHEYDIIIKEMQDNIKRCIDKLNDSNYLTFLLLWEQETTYKELATILEEATIEETNETTIKKRVERSFNAIVKCMKLVYRVA